MLRVDTRAVLAAFDEQMRRSVRPSPGARVEIDERVTRQVAEDGSWAAVLWSRLAAEDADAVIAAEIARAPATYFEWKQYAHDGPPDLAARLAGAGLTVEPAETVMVADLADLDLAPVVPDGLRLVPVDDEAGVDAMVDVHLAVFGDVHPGTREAVLASLALEPRPVEAVVACAGSTPVSAGRVEFHEGTEFASLWGGGTLPGWRGHGVFTALVAWRAHRARERGFRYLQVDALPTSRPILQRLGFVPLAETTPWVAASGRDPAD
jgi:GNAT superfamily N-acetyltransferase